MTDLFTTQPHRSTKPGQANGEFLGHLVEVAQGRKDLNWLRTKCTPDTNPAFANANLKHWGLK